MKRLLNLSLIFAAALSLVGCFDESKPNYQYMPNMYEPIGYETYGEYEIFENGQSALLPAPLLPVPALLLVPASVHVRIPRRS